VSISPVLSPEMEAVKAKIEAFAEKCATAGARSVIVSVGIGKDPESAVFARHLSGETDWVLSSIYSLIFTLQPRDFMLLLGTMQCDKAFASHRAPHTQQSSTRVQ